jgi:hypothetical protein
VVDLKYRLQATEENMASFLQIITSMHLKLSTDPVVSAPGEAPETAMGASMDRME